MRAELGVRAGAHDETRATAVGDHRAGVRHVVAIADRKVAARQRCRGLVHRHRLAGQCGLVGLQVDGLDQPRVGGHPVTGAQHDDIARDDFACRDLAFHAITQHAGHRRGHLAQCLDRPFGAILLNQAEQHGEDDDDGDRHRFEEVSQRRRQHDGDQQDDDQNVGELCREDRPRRHARGGAQFVRPVACCPGPDLVDGEPADTVRGEAARDLVRRALVPAGCGGCCRCGRLHHIVTPQYPASRSGTPCAGQSPLLVHRLRRPLAVDSCLRHDARREVIHGPETPARQPP